MRHIDPGLDNLLFITSRMTKGERFQHVLVSRDLAEAILLSSKTSNNAIVFPLYLYPEVDCNSRGLGFSEARRSNYTDGYLLAVSRVTGLTIVDGLGDLSKRVGVEDILRFIVAILHSGAYRERYAELLSRDFPRIPLSENLELFRALSRCGGELVAVHLLESAKLDRTITDYLGGQAPAVEKVSWSKNTVWLNKAQTTGFKGVREEVWNFHIGGYQVCEKWLKDRKGRTLSKHDIVHYQKIVVALSETIRLMKEIDVVIEQHGGWPGAFQTNEGDVKKAPECRGA
jgi:predicted helicase